MITRAYLDARATLVNRLLGRPIAQYTKADGKYTPNVGNLFVHVSYGKSRYTLREMAASGGERWVRELGMTASEMAAYLDGMLDGIEMHQIE